MDEICGLCGNAFEVFDLDQVHTTSEGEPVCDDCIDDMYAPQFPTPQNMSLDRVRSLFGGTRQQAKVIDAAIREAQASAGRAAAFMFSGTEYVLMQSLDDDTWSYRLCAA
jgi:hypothetical protein